MHRVKFNIHSIKKVGLEQLQNETAGNKLTDFQMANFAFLGEQTFHLGLLFPTNVSCYLCRGLPDDSKESSQNFL